MTYLLGDCSYLIKTRGAWRREEERGGERRREEERGGERRREEERGGKRRREEERGGERRRFNAGRGGDRRRGGDSSPVECSPAWSICTRAPVCAWRPLMVSPPRPMMRPTISLGHSTTFWPCPGPTYPWGRAPRPSVNWTTWSVHHALPISRRQTVGGAGPVARRHCPKLVCVFHRCKVKDE